MYETLCLLLTAIVHFGLGVVYARVFWAPADSGMQFSNDEQKGNHNGTRT